eukprot:IDg22811t1
MIVTSWLLNARQDDRRILLILDSRFLDNSSHILINMFDVRNAVRCIQKVIRSSALLSWRCTKELPQLAAAHNNNRRK